MSEKIGSVGSSAGFSAGKISGSPSPAQVGEGISFVEALSSAIGAFGTNQAGNESTGGSGIADSQNSGGGFGSAENPLPDVPEEKPKTDLRMEQSIQAPPLIALTANVDVKLYKAEVEASTKAVSPQPAKAIQTAAIRQEVPAEISASDPGPLTDAKASNIPEQHSVGAPLTIFMADESGQLKPVASRNAVPGIEIPTTAEEARKLVLDENWEPINTESAELWEMPNDNERFNISNEKNTLASERSMEKKAAEPTVRPVSEQTILERTIQNAQVSNVADTIIARTVKESETDLRIQPNISGTELSREIGEIESKVAETRPAQTAVEKAELLGTMKSPVNRQGAQPILTGEEALKASVMDISAAIAETADTNAVATELKNMEIPEAEEVLPINQAVGIQAQPLNQEQPIQIREAGIGRILEQVQPREIVDQIVKHIQVSVTEERSEMIVRLDPPELGELRIYLSMDKTGLATELAAQSDTVRSFIQTHLPEVRQALSDAGIQVSRFEVSSGADFEMGRNGSGQHQPARDQRFNPGFENGFVNDEPALAEWSISEFDTFA